MRQKDARIHLVCLQSQQLPQGWSTDSVKHKERAGRVGSRRKGWGKKTDLNQEENRAKTLGDEGG